MRLKLTKDSILSLVPFDSTLIAPFAKYPKLKYLKPEVVQLYKKHNYSSFGMTATV
jgi:hypothetical protein